MEQFKKQDAYMKYFGTQDHLKAWKEKLKGFDSITMEDLVKMKLPYYAPGPHDPPLPTPEDLVDAPGISSGWEQSYIRMLHEKYIVKFSRSPYLFQEAENLLFLEQFSFIHTPKVYAVFEHQGADPLKRYAGTEPPRYYYIIMEYIKGDTLAAAWPKMSLSEKEEIYRQIGTALRQLRSVPQPLESVTQGPYYGRFGYQGFQRLYQMVSDHRRPFGGPYHSYEELVQQMAETAEMGVALSTMRPEYDAEEVDALMRFKPALLAASPDIDDRRPVITHLDLRPENLILRPRSRKTTGEAANGGSGYEVVFIDWETAGWLPGWADIDVLQKSSWHMTGDDDDLDHYLDVLLGAMGPCGLAVTDFLTDMASSLHYSLMR